VLNVVERTIFLLILYFISERLRILIVNSVAVRSGFEARGELPRDVMGSFELMYFVMALHRTVGDCDALSAVWPGHQLATCHRFLWRRGSVQLPASCGSSIGATF
jgi:hypothetical protein